MPQISHLYDCDGNDDEYNMNNSNKLSSFLTASPFAISSLVVGISALN